VPGVSYLNLHGSVGAQEYPENTIPLFSKNPGGGDGRGDAPQKWRENSKSLPLYRLQGDPRGPQRGLRRSPTQPHRRPHPCRNPSQSSPVPGSSQRSPLLRLPAPTAGFSPVARGEPGPNP